MTNFLSNFYKLCDQKGRSPSAVVDEIGLGRSTLSRWRNGAMPQAQTVQKIADYFGISADDILTSNIVSTAEPVAALFEFTETEKNEILEVLGRRPEMRIFFSVAREATAEDIKKAITSLLERM